MQGRMKQHPLTTEEIEEVLNKADVGRLATQNENGFPYVVPVHFVRLQNKIYIHGLIKGQKISNLIRCEKVGFEVDEMGDILPDPDLPCDTNTAFRSVIILGTARMIEEKVRKVAVLQAIIAKYTPQLSGLPFPEKMMKATGIIEVSPLEITGKYYR